MRLLALCLFAFCPAAAAHFDLEPYPDGTLAQALASKPGPAFELLPADERLRVATKWSGHARNASPEVVPLLRAWNDRRRRGEAGPVLGARGKLVELELQEDGKSYWVLLDQELVSRRALVGEPYGLPGVVLLHRIGYAQGRAVAAIVGLGFRQYAQRAGYYRSGEARLVYAGKRYIMPIDNPSNPERPPSNRLQTFTDSGGKNFESVSLHFAQGPDAGLVISMHLRGAGAIRRTSCAGSIP